MHCLHAYLYAHLYIASDAADRRLGLVIPIQGEPNADYVRTMISYPYSTDGYRSSDMAHRGQGHPIKCFCGAGIYALKLHEGAGRHQHWLYEAGVWMGMIRTDFDHLSIKATEQV